MYPFPKYFWLVISLANYTICHGSPLWLQSYTLCRAVRFLWGFHSSTGWFPQVPHGATTYSLETTTLCCHSADLAILMPQKVFSLEGIGANVQFPSSREKQVLQMWVLLKVQWEKVKSIPYPFALHKHPHYYLPLKGQACRTNLYVLYYRTYGLTQSDGRPDFVLCRTTDTLMVHWRLLILWQEVQSMSPFKTFRRHLLHFLSFPPNNMHEEAGRGLCQIELLNLRVRRVPPQARDLNHFQS